MDKKLTVKTLNIKHNTVLNRLMKKKIVDKIPTNIVEKDNESINTQTNIFQIENDIKKLEDVYYIILDFIPEIKYY